MWKRNLFFIGVILAGILGVRAAALSAAGASPYSAL